MPVRIIIQNNPSPLVIVGHTNTGKTSFLRTLLRDGAFGGMADTPSTTRHVECSAASDDPDTLVYLYDTPELEDAGGLLDWLGSHIPSRSDGIERLQPFPGSPKVAADFNQEAKVLCQLLQSDMALYVVDAREPVLSKYKDELMVLSWYTRPVVPVFNFVGGQDLSAWTTMLARRNLYVYNGFDTVAFDFEGEIRLWGNLATVLPEYAVLDRLIAVRHREWYQLDDKAKREIAGFLLDVAAYRQGTEADGTSDDILQTIQAEVRQLEGQLQQRLLQVYRFYQSEVDTAEWAFKAFCQDPFSRDLLVQYGIRTGTEAATNALIGMGVDMITLSGSLGLGAAIGGIIGGVLLNVQDISDGISGRQVLHIDAETITPLAARAMDLLGALQKRDHAAQTPVRLQKGGRASWQPFMMPSELNKACRQWKWSSFNTRRPEMSHGEWEEAVESLRRKLQ